MWITLGYFSSMELLQAFTYTVIDDCSSPSNQIATLLGYLHIAFQPFFINAISMYFIPDEIRRKISIPVYAFCFAVAIYMILASYPFSWSGSCVGSLCSERLCSVSGSWHIAWELPLNLIDYWNFGFFKLLACRMCWQLFSYQYCTALGALPCTTYLWVQLSHTF